MSYGAPGCLSLAGTVLDDFVAGQVRQVLAPASLELSLAAEQALRAERVQLEGHWQQRLERARDAVERAARQYAAVEPENRLVARELEKGWEKALRHEQHEQEAYARFRQERPAALTPRQRDAIRRLSHDVPGLWHAPPTTAKDRQAIVRLLLEHVTVDVQGESEQVAVTLQWAGGFRSAHNVIRPVGRYTPLSTYPVLLSRLDALRGVGLSFAQIALELNRDGFAPPKRTLRFTGGMVTRLLRHRGLQGSRSRSMVEASVLQGHEYGLTDLARWLSMPCATLYKGQR